MGQSQPEDRAGNAAGTWHAAGAAGHRYPQATTGQRGACGDRAYQEWALHE